MGTKIEVAFQEFLTTQSGTIIELKYSPNLENEERNIMNLLSFRLIKNSKFMRGVENLCR
jgi:hypothetical protein